MWRRWALFGVGLVWFLEEAVVGGVVWSWREWRTEGVMRREEVEILSVHFVIPVYFYYTIYMDNKRSIIRPMCTLGTSRHLPSTTVHHH